MKRSRRDKFRSSKRTSVDIVPLIDVIFLLLAFFMLLTMSMVFQEGVPVELAKAGAGESVEEANRIVISIKENGHVFWEEELISLENLVERLGKIDREGDRVPRVLINADRGARHGKIIEVVDRIRSTEIKNVIFTVEPTS